MEKPVNNVQTFTHRVHFRKPGFEPVLITEEEATPIIRAKADPKYKKTASVWVGQHQCELGDIGIIEKLSNKLVRRGWYHCNNEQCNKENRQHRDGEHCDYDLTGTCANCGKKVIERSREYALYKWGKILCYECSPFGHAAKLFPGDTPDSDLSRMRGIAAYYIDKGLSDEDVMIAVNRDLSKKNVGSMVPGALPASGCKHCGHSKYHHNENGCSDCKTCEAYG